MFDKLKKAFSKLTRTLSETLVYREVKEKDLEPILDELLLTLVECDVAYEVAEKICSEIKKSIIGRKVRDKKNIEKIVRDALVKILMNTLVEPDKDIVKESVKKWETERKPYIIVFMGVNGVGKTTTIAKVAYLFKNNGVTPVIVAADTFRAGAQEQLEIHARRLGVPIIKAKYNSDPAAVCFDAVQYASKRGYKVVLIDTAGRMHTDPDLINELRKIIRVVKPDIKILVVDALTGNDAVEQARVFDEKIGVDYFILTKVDADAKGGAGLSVTAVTRKPILYVGVGQNYSDLEKFSRKWIMSKIVG